MTTQRNNLYTVQYLVTMECNSRCAYCNFWREPVEKDRELSLAGHKQVLEEILKAGVEYVDFTGGEPLLRDWLPELSAYVKSQGIFTTTTTNCIHFPESAERLVGKIDQINFSLDSLDEKAHNKLRGVDSYNSVIQSLEIARKLMINHKIITTTLDDYERKISLLTYAVQSKTSIYFSPVFSYFGNKNETAGNAQKIMELLFEPYVQMGLALYELVISREKEEKHLPSCGALHKSLVISPYGTILLPCHQQTKKEMRVGSDISRVLASAEFQEAKACVGKNESCADCFVNFHIATRFPLKFDKYFFLEALSLGKNALFNCCGPEGLIRNKLQIKESYLVLLKMIRSVENYDGKNPLQILELSSDEKLYLESYLQENSEFWNFKLFPAYFIFKYFEPGLAFLKDRDFPDKQNIFEKSYQFLIHLWIFFILKKIKKSFQPDDSFKEKIFFEIKEYLQILSGVNIEEIQKVVNYAEDLIKQTV